MILLAVTFDQALELWAEGWKIIPYDSYPHMAYSYGMAVR